MNNPAANAANAANAAKLPAPAWMACATIEELNVYLKKIKTGGAKAEAIRAKWAAANATDVGATPAEAAAAVADVVQNPAEVLVLPPDSDKPVESPETGAEAPDAPAADKSEHPVAEVPVIEDKAVQPRKAKASLVQQELGGRLTKLFRPVATAAAEVARSPLTTVYLDPRLIDVKDEWNARTDMGDLEELGRQIKSQKALDGIGLLHDLRVQEKGDGSGRYWLVDGERRWQAVMGLIDAGEDFPNGIPCKVEPANASTDDLIIKMFLANEGKPLLPYEEGLFFKRLSDSGMTMKEIEEKTGRSDSTIWYGLALVEADDDLVDAIRKGTVGATIAKTIAVNARGNKQRQKELVAKAKQAKGDKAKTAELKKEIDEERRKKAAKERPGLTLKARKADEADIAAMGEKVGLRLKELMESFGLDFDTDLAHWVSDDRELQIAANFGALQALKAIMGVKCKVTF